MSSRDSIAARTRRTFIPLVLVIAGVLIAGCSSKSSSAPASAAGSASAVGSASAASSAVVSPSAAPASSGSAAGTTIVGTWATGTTYQSANQPFVTFAADGTWTASDGCNRVQGTWKESAPQTLAVTSGPMTMMACDGAPLPGAVAGTHTYKVTDEKLTLYDKAGKELVSLVPGAAPAAGSSAAVPSS